MSLGLSIGGVELKLDAASEVLDAVARRYGPFVSDASEAQGGSAPIRIDIRSRPDRFVPGYERPVDAEARLSGPEEIVLEGGVSGRYSIAARRGIVENARGLGAVDALLRIALSAALPPDGALLLHGAALRHGAGGGIALCGASGSGKSTAARAFGGFCDEHVVLRPARDGVELWSTPYWAGRPYRASCREVLCLERGGPRIVRLARTEAVRTLARHVVRYVSVETIERTILGLLCRIAASTDIRLAACPEGDPYLPFLGRSLGIAEVSACVVA